MQKNKEPASFTRWYIWFLASSWMVVSFLLYLQIPKKIIWQNFSRQAQEKNTDVRVLLKNKEKENLQKDNKAVILSDTDNRGEGKLTPNKDFLNRSEENDLSFARKGNNADTETAKHKQMPQKNTDSFIVKFVRLLQKKVKEKSQGREGNFDWAQSEYTRIPDSYTFKKEFALSWTNAGQPVIPTQKYAHYQYFRDMIDKIRAHWYPPGGSYYPPIGDDFFTTSGFAPGYTRVQTFPEQEVQTVFILDKEGNVLEAKIFSSLRYRSLDQSCLDAINKSKNFGTPPAELLEKGTLIVPFLFRLIAK